MPGFNWDDLRVFLAFVRGGNAYAAAQTLSVDHTTVRRRIRALEASLSTKLIDTTGNHLTLTDGGEDLFERLESIEADITKVSHRISGADRSVVGRVRVGAPDGFGSVFLAPHLAGLRLHHPGLIVEMLSHSRQFNVASREVDVAILISYPPPSRHIIRKLGSVRLRLYAAEEYLARHEPINSLADLQGHDFVGYLEDHPFLPTEAMSHRVFEHFRGASFVSNSVISQFNATVAGAGICLLPGYMARSSPNLRPILPDELTMMIDMHLLLHADLRNIARYRITADFIAEVVKREVDLFG